MDTRAEQGDDRGGKMSPLFSEFAFCQGLTTATREKR
jgi:hypothetical protein